MIKIFRKTRQNSINENKSIQYFKYGIGEIVLVVIGILIALQINNWNENKKQEKLVQNYYVQLLLDFQNEKTNLNSHIKFLDKSILSYNKYLKAFETPNLTTTNVIQKIASVDPTNKIIAFNSNTIKTLISIGDLKLIPLDIRNKLLGFYTNQKNIIEINKGNNGFIFNAMKDAMESGLNPVMARLSTQPILSKELNKEVNKPQLILNIETAFFIKNFSEKNQLRYYKEMLVDIDTLSKLIKKEQKIYH